MTLSTLFKNCLEASYTTVGNAADFATERDGNTLFIYFEASDGETDWKNNLDFPAKPYRHMSGRLWFAHRGFLKVWKTLEGYLAETVMDKTVNSITVVGYSHGAALAVLCYEYVWYNRPDLRDRLEGYGFGCPRVLWGLKHCDLSDRWENFLVIRNIDDIVTHMPPALFGFYHVGQLLEIGERGKYSAIDAHRPENILKELYAYERDYLFSPRLATAK